MRLIAFIWILFHAVITGCITMAIFVETEVFTTREAIALSTGAAFYWVSLVWAAAIFARKRG